MSAPDTHERELWALLHAVETHTASRYSSSAPELAPEDREACLHAMQTELVDDTVLDGTHLDAPLRRLLAAAVGDGSGRDAALLQGLLLERLGVVLYRTLAEGGRLSERGEVVARRALLASRDASGRATRKLRAELPDPADRFDVFASRSTPLLASLDAFGEALDARFADRLGLRFADVMGDFVADLLPCCVDELGFERRRVVVHLTGALMG